MNMANIECWILTDLYNNHVEQMCKCCAGRQALLRDALSHGQEQTFI